MLERGCIWKQGSWQQTSWAKEEPSGAVITSKEVSSLHQQITAFQSRALQAL